MSHGLKSQSTKTTVCKCSRSTQSDRVILRISMSVLQDEGGIGMREGGRREGGIELQFLGSE